jgi:Undecaprenyl-phosphate glucose phosphotransferase
MIGASPATTHPLRMGYGKDFARPEERSSALETKCGARRMEDDSGSVRSDHGKTPPVHGDVSAPQGRRYGARRSSASGGQSAAGTRTINARTISQPVVCGLLRFFDGIWVFSTALLSVYCYSVMKPDYRFDPVIFVLIAVVAAFSSNTVFNALKLYQFARLSELGWELKRILAGWVGIVLVGLSIAFLTKTSADFSRVWLVTWLAATILGLSGGRLMVAYLIGRWSANGRMRRQVAIVGTGLEASRLIEECRACWSQEVQLVGVFDDRGTRVAAELFGTPLLGGIDMLASFVRTSIIDEIIIALPCSAADRINQVVKRLRELPIDLRLWIDVSARKMAIKGIEYRGGVTVATLADRPLKHWSALQKRVEDTVLAVILLLLTAPLLLLAAVAIKWDSPGPIFFRQQRFGFNNNVIEVVKFRTMFVDQCDPSGADRTRSGDARVTRVGRLLRGTSLDELPQLFNVLMGSMSIVGPRPHPLSMKAVDRLYHEAVGEYFARHRVRPGITGLAQVSGHRGEIDTIAKAQKRVALDLEYIDNWCVTLDLKIICRTFAHLMGSDAY